MISAPPGTAHRADPGQSLRQSLIMSNGDDLILFQRRISRGLRRRHAAGARGLCIGTSISIQPRLALLRFLHRCGARRPPDGDAR
jgi:hypothetical protein